MNMIFTVHESICTEGTVHWNSVIDIGCELDNVFSIVTLLLEIKLEYEDVYNVCCTE